LPPALPCTLYGDMAWGRTRRDHRARVIIARDRHRPAQAAYAPLSDATDWLALPRAYELTTPGALLGGGHAGYNVYPAKRGWVAVAALEPHFAKALAAALEMDELRADRVAARFATEDAEHWKPGPSPGPSDRGTTKRLTTRKLTMQIKDHAFLITGGAPAVPPRRNSSPSTAARCCSLMLRMAPPWQAPLAPTPST
jgi:hypothetical protein